MNKWVVRQLEIGIDGETTELMRLVMLLSSYISEHEVCEVI